MGGDRAAGCVRQAERDRGRERARWRREGEEERRIEAESVHLGEFRRRRQATRCIRHPLRKRDFSNLVQALGFRVDD
jgi:hypothetical protein